MELNILPEDEPTTLEYARFHGLCTNYALENPLYPITPPLLDEAFDQDFNDPPDAPPVTNPANELTKERLVVNKETALLLRSVYLLSEPLDELQLISDGMRHIVNSKQEVALLRSDNELDMLHFGNTETPRLDDLRIPLESVDNENDEGLEWPSRYAAYPTRCYEQVKVEKLEVPKETLFYLQRNIRDHFEPSDVEKIVTEGLTCKRSIPLQPLTPPLLPLTPPMTPYIPSSPTNNLPLLSEDSNSTAAEAQALSNSIMRADALLQPDVHGNSPTPIEIPDIDRSSPTIDHYADQNKRKAEESRVEGPLTPPIFSDSPSKKLKSVSFSAMLQFIPEVPSTYENGDYILCPEDDFAGFYPEDVVEEMNREVDNEKLSDADTTKRVDVPYLDFTPAVAPWAEYKKHAGDHGIEGTELESQTRFLLHMKRSLLKGAETWHGVSKLERDLRWDPMPAHSTKITIDEKLHGEEDFGKLIDEMSRGDIVTGSSSIWKRDRPRIFENEEEEEDGLEPAEPERPEETENLITLAMKRKLELDEADTYVRHERKGQITPPPPPDELSNPVCKINESPDRKGGVRTQDVPSKPRAQHDNPTPAKRQATAIKSIAHTPKDSSNSIMFSGRFSTSNALENFMAIQGMSVGPLKADKHNTSVTAHFPARTLPVNSRQPTTEQVLTYPLENVNPKHQAGPQPPPPPPLPSIPMDLPPCSFIISSALLQQRSLSKQIEQLYPNAEFVSRDFDLPHSAAKEADLLLSPSTGLVIVTLQQVKQRALPGQPDHSPTKERIASLQHRYERLVVMVTEGLNREMEGYGSGRPTDTRDQGAIEAFEQFALQMQGEVLVRYVSGGEQALSRSIVREMTIYGLPHGSQDIGDIKPLPDETNWELFLRRAGLNPFAAQVILAWLKNTVDYPLASSSSPSSPGRQARTVPTFGLQTFLMMPAEERVQSFQAVLGGSRVLRRVCALLDMEWVSAAHGFRM